MRAATSGAEIGPMNENIMISDSVDFLYVAIKLI